MSNPKNGEGPPPTYNKYARRGDIVFFGGGGVLVIGLSIIGGLAYFDAFHTSPQKSVAGNPEPSEVAEKPSAPPVPEKSTLVPPSAPRTETQTASPAELSAASAPEPGSYAAVADNPPKPQEPQLTPQTSPELPEPLVTTDQTPPVVSDEPVNTAARELIMRGWALYSLPYTPWRWQEARDAFERALELDPRASEARIGLASILAAKLADGWSPVLQEDMPQAEHLLLEALDKGSVSNRATAHFTLGLVRQNQNRLADAQSEFETAISLDPNNARTYLHLGQARLFLGQPEAGIAPLEEAIRLGPDDLDAGIIYWTLGTCQLLLGRVDQAINLLQKARAANARLWVPYFYLAGAYGLRGDLEKARSALAESMRLKPAIRSLARMRVENAWLDNPQYWSLQEKTLNLGLRRVGLTDQ